MDPRDDPLHLLLEVDLRDRLVPDAGWAGDPDGSLAFYGRDRVGDRYVVRVLHQSTPLLAPGAPRVTVSAMPLWTFAIGTARGTHDQEGRALWLERDAGFLDYGRRRELALRRLAARAVEARADFVATVRLLCARGAALALALRVAARVHRGGGLGREAVYVPALLRVEDAMARDRGMDGVMRVGRVSVESVGVLVEWI